MRKRRMLCIVLVLAMAFWAMPAGAAADVQITCGYTVNGAPSQQAGFSVRAERTPGGNEITSAAPGQTIVFTAAAAEGYYTAGWEWEADGDDENASPDMEWEFSEDTTTLTISLGEDFQMQKLNVTANFETAPPTSGSVALTLQKKVQDVPQAQADKAVLTAVNEIGVPITSAQPGQPIAVEADLPSGCHVHAWTICCTTAAGESELAADQQDWNEVAVNVPENATALRIEAQIQPGAALSLGCAVDGENMDGERGFSLTAKNAQGDAVSCLQPGQPVTLSAAAPEGYVLSKFHFYPSPDTDAEESSYLTVVPDAKDAGRCTVTLMNDAEVNSIAAIADFLAPSDVSVQVTPAGSGTIQMTPAQPAPGELVTVQIVPESGYVVTGWTAEGTADLVSGQTPDIVTFEMPDNEVALTALVETYEEALRTVIAAAEDVKAAILVSSDNGADCPKDMLWTTPENAAAFDTAIAAAQTALDTPDADLAAALAALEEATRLYADTAAEGTSDALPVSVSEVNGQWVVTGLSMSTSTGTAPAVQELAASLSSLGSAATIQTADGMELPDGTVCATGMTAAWDDASTPDATVVVSGDVLGTGKIALSQLTRIAAAFAGTKPLEGAYLIAGDFGGTGSIGLTDLVKEAAMYAEYQNQEENPTGAWTIPEDPSVTDAMREELAAAAGLPADAYTGSWYEPVACVGMQLTEGTNYRILLTRQNEAEPDSYVIFTMHVDTEGGAKVMDVSQCDYPVPQYADGLLGAWNEPATPAVPQEVAEAVRKADRSYKPAAYLGFQVVAGQNYLVCCEKEGGYAIVCVWSKALGGAEITRAEDFMPSEALGPSGSILGS